MAIDTQVTGARPGVSHYPRYDAAALGYRNYWYPVMFAKDLGKKPVGLTLLGERIVFCRGTDGRAYALHDRCPHRGIPLSLGKQEFPGKLVCAYHGWTFDLASGVMTACLTDGPDSPLCGKVRVDTYPVEERVGLVWVYVGDDSPPPVEADLPEEWQRPNTVLVGRISTRPGDWRHAAENGIDEGHGKYLHRSALWVTFRYPPAWAIPRMVPEGEWITRASHEFQVQAEYPGIGVWPRRAFWKRDGGLSRVSIRLPGILRVARPEYSNYEWYVPTVQGEHRYYQFLTEWRGTLAAWWLRLRYVLYVRYLFHQKFNDQDGWVIPLMETPPERLYRPDVSVIAWRKLCEERARGLIAPTAALAEQRAEDAEELRLSGALG
jgi:phenylpropionate dioxygenase-like ring-hydroxylating dioxygenase large terminal subunit